MRIQHNVMAMNAYRNYSNNTSALSKNLERLSSGYKINRAGDDAAGLAISEKMRAQITGLEAAQKNVKDGISLVNTAEGAMQEVQDMLNRMVYLAQESANGTYDNEVDRANLQKELDQLNSEIDRIADSANFNGIKLLDGSLGFNDKAFTVTAGTGATAGADMTSDVITSPMPAAIAAAPGNQTAAAGTVLHKSGNEAQKGTFTVDLSQMNVESKDDSTKAKVTITIGDLEVDVEATNDGDTMTGKDIATKLATALGAGKEFVVKAADGTTTQVGATGYTPAAGDLAYTVTDKGNGTLTFETSKYFDGTAWQSLTDGKPTADVGDGALVSPGFDVKIADSGTTTKSITGNPNIDGTNTQTPAKPGTSDFGNTYLTLDLTKITDGVKMTIGEQEKTFGTDIKIDDLNLANAADKLTLMDRITQAFADNKDLTVGQDAGTPGKLTLSEKTDGAGKSLASADAQKKMETLTGFQSLVSFTAADTKATTKLDITESAINNGDGVTVGDTTYVFTDKANLQGTTSGNTTYLAKTNAAANLKAALDKAGYATDISGTSTLTISAKDATATTGPQILGKGLTLQIGDTSDPYNQLSVVVGDIHASVLGTRSISIADQQSAADAVDVIKNAINTISSIRGTLGATSNRLDHTANNLSVMRENITDAESSIRDTDIAEEMMSYTKNNILVQSAQAMLAQANQVPQGVLQLLQ